MNFGKRKSENKIRSMLCSMCPFTFLHMRNAYSHSPNNNNNNHSQTSMYVGCTGKKVKSFKCACFLSFGVFYTRSACVCVFARFSNKEYNAKQNNSNNNISWEMKQRKEQEQKNRMKTRAIYSMFWTSTHTYTHERDETGHMIDKWVPCVLIQHFSSFSPILSHR